MQNPGDPIVLPTKLKSTQVDYECELAVVIGKTCKNATKENALDYVLGYTCGNDVSARDWQKDFGGGAVVPRQDVRHVRPARPVPGDSRTRFPIRTP